MRVMVEQQAIDHLAPRKYRPAVPFSFGQPETAVARVVFVVLRPDGFRGLAPLPGPRGISRPTEHWALGPRGGMGSSVLTHIPVPSFLLDLPRPQDRPVVASPEVVSDCRSTGRRADA